MVTVVAVVAAVSQESSVWRKRGGGERRVERVAVLGPKGACRCVCEGACGVEKRDVVAVCYCLMCKVRRTGRKIARRAVGRVAGVGEIWGCQSGV